MNRENRKPLLIAAICVVLAVVVFALGAGFGGRPAGGAANWKDRLGALDPGTDLTISELQPVGGNCEVAGSRISIIGSCVLAVAEFGGPFSLEVIKRTELVSAASVKITLTLEGTSTTAKIDPGCRISAVIGRSGGTLTVSCTFPTSPCTVEAGQGRDCSKE